MLKILSIIMERTQICGIHMWMLNAFVLLCSSYVRCQYEGDIRLVDGPTSSEGRVEVYHSGQWGTVCDDSWDNTDARVVCRQLGYSSVGAVARSNAYYGQGSGPIHLDNVNCTGYETRLAYCSSKGWGVGDCWHGDDAGVSCSYNYAEGTIRLVNGSTPNQGRVEIFFNRQWGTVCDNGWSEDEARVVCRQLGYPDDFAYARSNAYYGEGSGPIHFDYFSCLGFEPKLTYCRKSPWGDRECEHGEDAGVHCDYVTTSTTVFPFKPTVSSKVVGMMSFVGVTLFLLTLVAIGAVCYTCYSSKPAVRTYPSEQLPLSNIVDNTPAAPTTNGITYPSDITQLSIQPPSQLPANAYPPAAESDPPSAPPPYVSTVESSNPLLPPTQANHQRNNKPFTDNI